MDTCVERYIQQQRLELLEARGAGDDQAIPTVADRGLSRDFWLPGAAYAVFEDVADVLAIQAERANGAFQREVCAF